MDLGLDSKGFYWQLCTAGTAYCILVFIFTIVFLAGAEWLLEFAKSGTGQLCAAKHEIILCEKSVYK